MCTTTRCCEQRNSTLYKGMALFYYSISLSRCAPPGVGGTRERSSSTNLSHTKHPLLLVLLAPRIRLRVPVSEERARRAEEVEAQQRPRTRAARVARREQHADAVRRIFVTRLLAVEERRLEQPALAVKARAGATDAVFLERKHGACEQKA